MIRLYNLYLPSRLFTFVAIDAAILLGVGVVTVHPAFLHLHNVPAWRPIMLAALMCAVFLWCMYLFDLYQLDLKPTWQDIFVRSLRALGVAILLLIPVWWLVAPKDAKYQELEISLVAFALLVCLYRLAVEQVRHKVFRSERLLLIGNGMIIDLLSGALKERHSLPFQVSGVVKDAKNARHGVQHFATCGTLDQLDELCEKFRPHRIAVGLREVEEKTLPEKLLRLRRQGVLVEDAISLYEALSGRVPVNQVDAKGLAFGGCFYPNTILSAIYTMFGLLLASVIAVVFSPLLLLVAIAIKLDSRGPVFYQQERVGINGKTFRACKFRSMRINAEAASGPVWASENDPRVTRVGRILRTLRLDEFAQLWNVIRGDMCLVGPRPERPHFTQMLNKSVPHYDLRHCVPPGITGWAQVNASYGASVDESRIKLEYDLFYIKNQSPLLDAVIMFKTMKIALFGRGSR
jgi:exopolysaccharide biosynthesis polyprenyl glycosylphosphotransferase